MKGGVIVRKLITIIAISVPVLLVATPAFAQTVPTTSTGSVTQIVTFIQSIVQVLITLAGTVAIGFFVWEDLAILHPLVIQKH